MFNIRPIAIPESFHKGTLPQKQSFIATSSDSVIMSAFKFCEDGSGDLIMRFIEARGESVNAEISCKLFNADIKAEFGANETKTFRIAKDGSVRETNFLEGIVG